MNTHTHTYSCLHVAVEAVLCCTHVATKLRYLHNPMKILRMAIVGFCLLKSANACIEYTLNVVLGHLLSSLLYEMLRMQTNIISVSRLSARLPNVCVITLKCLHLDCVEAISQHGAQLNPAVAVSTGLSLWLLPMHFKHMSNSADECQVIYRKLGPFWVGRWFSDCKMYTRYP